MNKFNNKKKFYLKKYVPIYKAQQKICIGFVGKEDYIEFEYTEHNYNVIEKLLKDGIQESCLKNELYKKLRENNFLENKHRFNKNDLDSRSTLYIDYLLKKDLSSEINEARQKSILVFGAGAGGSSLIYLLAQFGFNSLSVIDYDTVEESDIGRVTIFDNSDIGAKKVVSLKNKIKNNFDIEINIIDAKLTDEDELSKVISVINPEIIVKACDPDGVFLTNLNKICFNQNIPYISMAYAYELLKIGPLIVPHVTSCSEALSKDAEKHYGQHYKIDQFKKLFSEYLFHPSISFNINILSSLVFKEILFFLLAEFDQCQTIGRIIMFNPLSFSTYSYLIECDDNCKICYYEGKAI